MTLQATSLSQLTEIKRQLEGIVIPLPPFVPGTEFNARVRRLLPIDLVTAGQIPNSLLVAVNSLFEDQQERKKNNEPLDMTDERLNDFSALIEATCEAALLEPTVQELREIGLELTDDQKLTVWYYTQAGVSALQTFRSEQRHDPDSQCGDDFPDASISPGGTI